MGEVYSLAARRIIRKLERRRAMDEMVRIAEEHGFYEIKPQVCITHMRFLPCRRKEGCVFSTDPDDIESVREFNS